MATSPPFDAVEIRRMLAQFLESTRTGYEKGGIARIAQPSVIARVIQTITQDTSEKIDQLMREVVGEAISLSAGPSIGGGPALSAFSALQAQALVSMRQDIAAKLKSRPDIVQCLTIVETHQLTLIEWVVTGQYNHAQLSTWEPQIHKQYGDDIDLDRVAAEFLAVPELRIPVCAPFLACTAIFISAIRTSSLWYKTPPSRDTHATEVSPGSA